MSNVNSGKNFIPVSKAQVTADLATHRQLYQNSDDFPLPPGGLTAAAIQILFQVLQTQPPPSHRQLPQVLLLI